MRGTLLRGRWNPQIVVSVLVMFTLTIGGGVYQIVGRADTIPGSAGGVGPPAGDRGVQGAPSEATIAAWAGAAAAGDYATAQRSMEDDTLLYGLWQANHSYFQQQIVGYQIVSRDTVGQTTTAVVRFDLASNYATCIPLTINETTQRIRIDRGYTQCPTQP